MERVHYLYAGTVDEIKRKLAEMVEACNPSSLVWWIAQGFSPLSVVQRQLEIFSEQIMPACVGEPGQEGPVQARESAPRGVRRLCDAESAQD